MNNSHLWQTRNKMSPTFAPVYHLEKISKPQHMEGERKSNTAFFLSWGGKSWKSGKAKVAEVLKTERIALQWKNSRNLQSPLWVYNRILIHLKPMISIITLKINGLNTPIKRQIILDCIKKAKTQLYATYKKSTLNIKM